MSRRSLRPQLNQIRGWVRQGRTDAWIAHQLEVTVQQIQAFKREHGLEPDGDAAADGAGADDVDLRAEDDAAIAAELEAEEVRRAEEEAKAAEEAARKAAEAGGRRGGGARARRQAQASAWARPRPRPQEGGRPAGGHVRPRRGGLRPVARPRRRGRPGVRRALGGPPPRRGHDRGGPDRDPPRRRRRGRRRLTSTASSRTCARSRTRSPSGRSPCPGAPPCSTRACRGCARSTSSASRRRTACVPSDIAFAAETRFPAQPAVEVLHEPIGTTVAPAFAAAGWQVSRHLLMALEGPPPDPAACGRGGGSRADLAAARRVDARRAVGDRRGGRGDARVGAGPRGADRRARVLRARRGPARIDVPAARHGARRRGRARLHDAGATAAAGWRTPSSRARRARRATSSRSSSRTPTAPRSTSTRGWGFVGRGSSTDSAARRRLTVPSRAMPARAASRLRCASYASRRPPA